MSTRENKRLIARAPLTLDWHYTMACLPGSLLKKHRRLATYATTMHIRFVYESNGENKAWFCNFKLQ